MNKRLLSAMLIAVSVSTFALAQTKEPSKKEKQEKEESITIRKKSDKDEKMTIVIDGDKITINGKAMEDMKDGDIEILRNKGMNSLGTIMPKIRGRIAPMMGGNNFKMFSDGETANRAFLGVSSEKSDKGAKIISVEKESAAEKVGLKKDDIITKVGDTKIDGSDDLYEAIGKYKPEDKVSITYLRDGKTATASATLGKSKSPDVRVFNFKDRDLNQNFNRDFNFEMPDLKDLKELKVMPRMNGMEFNMTRKPRLGLQIQDVEEGKGVKVLDVDENTPSAKAGLQKGDVISQIDGKNIASVDELKAAVKDIKEGDSISVTFNRNGSTQSATIKFPKKLKTAEL
jgi:serine protease Do